MMALGKPSVSELGHLHNHWNFCQLPRRHCLLLFWNKAAPAKKIQQTAGRFEGIYLTPGICQPGTQSEQTAENLTWKFYSQPKRLFSQIKSPEIAINSISLDVWGGDSANSVFLENRLLAGYAVSSPFIGLLGLSGQETYPTNTTTSFKSPLQTLKNTSAVSGLTWAYTAGAKYKIPESYGSLTFGGFDSSLVDMDNALTDVEFLKNFNGNELTLSIKSITVGDRVASDTDMIALLDTMVPDIWLPKSVCDLFEDKFGLQWIETFGVYLVSDEQRDRLRTENTSVSFDLTSTINSSKVVSITLPYLAFDHEVKYPLAGIDDNRTTLYYFPLKRTLNDTTNFLGRTFFQEA